jgi:glyoxylase-like metal-dependent hydrolase (beta-lactamase superfamily II)
MDRLRVGDAEIQPVLEMALRQRPIASLGADAALVEANRAWLAPSFLEAGDTWSLNFQTWVLAIDDKRVVIDPCTDAPFIERFCATGVRPEQIDYVFCTHLHHDHCGWNTQLKDGRWVPTFPNARYLFLRREYERWDPNGANYRAVDYNEGVFERSVRPIVQAGLADVVLGRHQILPNLVVEPAHGHTSGHAMLHLGSNNEQAYFSGDCFHHPLQLTQPEIQFGDCDDVAQAIETRRRLVTLGLEQDALIIPAHLPSPYAGKVRRNANGGVWFDAGSGQAAMARGR